MGDISRQCPYCCEMVNREALKCPHCHTVLRAAEYLRKRFGVVGETLSDRFAWSCKQKRRRLLGVCAHLAGRVGLPLWLVRMIFIMMVILGGHGVFVYLLLFLVLPGLEDGFCVFHDDEPGSPPPARPTDQGKTPDAEDRSV